MTAPQTPSPAPERSALQRDAAIWFARMRGPDADASRPAFETWLATSPQHLGAYNRAAEIWSLGKFLSENPPSNTAPTAAEAPARPTRRMVLTMSASLVVGLLVVGLLVLVNAGNPLRDRHPDIAGPAPSNHQSSYELATMPGERRSVRLSDGSSVSLQPGTRVTVSLNDAGRRLRLERGGARFDVVHEARPFVVAAGSGTVTARGTLFEVALASGRRVSVRLLRGSVDVAMPTLSSSEVRPARMIARLMPGDRVAFGNAATPGQLTAPQVSGRFKTVDLDHVRLGDLLATANQDRPVRIGLEGPGLDGLEVSGTLRVDDPERLAERLGTVMNLRVVRQSPTAIVLQRP